MQEAICRRQWATKSCQYNSASEFQLFSLWPRQSICQIVSSVVGRGLVLEVSEYLQVKYEQNVYQVLVGTVS